MKRTLLIISATLALTGAAYAGPCTDRIAQLEKVMSDAGSGPTNTNEPTKGKPTAAQGGGDQSKQLSDALAAAKAADATGDAAGCGKALDEAQNYVRTE